MNKWEPVVPPSSAAPKSAPTPVASNNLKEQVVELTEAVWRLGRGTALDLPLDPELTPEEAATQILNLILDTILAKVDGVIADNSIATYNRAEVIKAMLEGKRT